VTINFSNGLKCSRGEGGEVAGEELFVVALEFEEHDAVAELGVAGDDASADVGWVAIEPESAIDVGADGHRDRQLDVAAAATEVGGFGAQRNVVALLAKLDLDLGGVARVMAALGMRDDRGCDLVVRQGQGRTLQSMDIIRIIGK